MTDPRRKEVDPDERRYWITPDEYKLLDRPLTDPPIGGSRGSHRVPDSPVAAEKVPFRTRTAKQPKRSP